MKNIIALHWEYTSNQEESITIYIDSSMVVYVRPSVIGKGTYISLSNGTSIVVAENVCEVLERIWGYKLSLIHI